MEKQYYWGRMHLLDADSFECKKIWLGPLTKQEMLDDFEEFRHMSREATKEGK